MIPARYGPVLFPLVMTFFMAGVVSALLAIPVARRIVGWLTAG